MIIQGATIGGSKLGSFTNGEVAYTTPGTYSWVAPAGVTSVSVVCVGGGASGAPWNGWGNPGGDSYFISPSVVQGGGGVGNFYPYYNNAVPSTYVGDGGGQGGISVGGAAGVGGGGAGGYTGNGGNGGAWMESGDTSEYSGQTAGQGGGGGGGAYNKIYFGGAGGGGVGIYGQGANGAAGRAREGAVIQAGGGSGGQVGGTGSLYGGSGGNYGGGGGAGNDGGTGWGGGTGGALGWKNNITVTPGQTYDVVVGAGGSRPEGTDVGKGGGGAVRIIWPGNIRGFPSNDCGDTIAWPQSALVPLEPTNVSAVATGTTSAEVSFTQPTYDGGSTITSYTAVSTPGGLTGTINQSGSGTITVNGLSSSTSYTFTVYATNTIGNSSNSTPSNSITTNAVVGEYVKTTTGATQWVVPDGVYSISVVCIGTGQNGTAPYTLNGSVVSGAGGMGGALAYKNNISVTPGETLTLSISGPTSVAYTSVSGSTTMVRAQNGIYLYASPIGDVKYRGGYGPDSGGGGGAGGYAGVGGDGKSGTSGVAAPAGSGAGAGGSQNRGGGGVGLYGIGSTGSSNGAGGSGGNSSTNINGGLYGGGGGGNSSTGVAGGTGGTGAIRIIWPGNERQFPSTRTAYE